MCAPFATTISASRRRAAARPTPSWRGARPPPPNNSPWITSAWKRSRCSTPRHCRLQARRGCRRVYKKLRLGKYELQASLDLHQKTLNEARQSLVQFIADCELRDIRCLLILHGKGAQHAARPAQKLCQRLAAATAGGNGHAQRRASPRRRRGSTTCCCARASARRQRTANAIRNGSASQRPSSGQSS